MYKVNNANEIFSTSEKYPFVVIFWYDEELWYWGSYKDTETAWNSAKTSHPDNAFVVRATDIEVL